MESGTACALHRTSAQLFPRWCPLFQIVRVRVQASLCQIHAAARSFRHLANKGCCCRSGCQRGSIARCASAQSRSFVFMGVFLLCGRLQDSNQTVPPSCSSRFGVAPSRARNAVQRHPVSCSGVVGCCTSCPLRQFGEHLLRHFLAREAIFVMAPMSFFFFFF